MKVDPASLATGYQHIQDGGSGWCPDRSAALEYVDDDHWRTAVPANEGWRHCDGGYDVGTEFDTGRHYVQQLAFLREILAPRWVREQTVMADTVEAAR
ncbi:hypothetical protein SBC2_74660 (plasmid) [Caballeronia sp. SBC2]|nr:hypothetical protein SBC2_74660 [Caballeronia sp. SBC2]